MLLTVGVLLLYSNAENLPVSITHHVTLICEIIFLAQLVAAMDYICTNLGETTGHPSHAFATTTTTTTVSQPSGL